MDQRPEHGREDWEELEGSVRGSGFASGVVSDTGTEAGVRTVVQRCVMAPAQHEQDTGVGGQ